MRPPNPHLLPEEDAIDDPDEDDEADPTLPGDLWYAWRRSMTVGEDRRNARRILAPGLNRGC